jgi:hypothetical protein
MKRSFLSFVILLTAVLFVTVAAEAQLLPVGSEVRVNTTTAETQSNPDVALDEAGNFIVVWESGSFFGGFDVFAQRYDASGTPLGGELQVNTFTNDDQSNPRVEMDADGNFVVVWLSFNQIPPAIFSIMGRRFDSGGNPISGEFEVSVGQTAIFPEMAMAPDGSFLVLWKGRPSGTSGVDSLYVRLYDGSGSPQAPPLQVGTMSGYEFRFDVAALSSGGWIVTWADFGLDSMSAQLYDAGGAALGPVRLISNSATGMAVAAGGDRIVVGLEGTGSGGGPGALLFDGSFAALAGPLQLSNLPTQPTQEVAVAMDGAGRFVSSWTELDLRDSNETVINPTRDGSQASILARVFDSEGDSLGNDFVVNTTTEGFQALSRLDMSPAGRLVAVWVGPGADFYDDVFAQVYGPNTRPVASCRNLTVAAGPSCTASASIDNGSFDPDGGDTVTLAQSPAGPYALGATSVTLTVTDNHDASNSCTGTVTVVDATVPAIGCPAAITADGISASGGAAVPFTVSATDSCDASVSVVAVPASGSLFPFGTTTVSATATDDSGNSAQCSFTVTVLTPQEQIDAIINEIEALIVGGTLAPNKANPLIAKLDSVAAKLDAGQVGAGCNQLGAFINQVNAYIGNGTLTAAQGQELIDATNAIRVNIGC